MALVARRLLSRGGATCVRPAGPGAAALWPVRALSSESSFACDTTTERHPLVNVAPLLPSWSGPPSARGEALRGIRAAFEGAGYFYAQGVDVLPASYLAEVYDYAMRAHALPIEVKRKCAREGGSGAYSGVDVGQAELEYEPGSVSTVRAWDYSRTRFTLSSGDFDQDRYPGIDMIQPAYVDFLDDLYERQNVLARSLMVAFAEMLELPASTFLDMFEGGDEGRGDFGTIRLLHYPGNPKLSEEEAAAATTGISPHTDFEAFTLMHQDAPGLQFIPVHRRDASGEKWIDAPVRPGEFVVTVGDALERFTNGVLKATPHRVTVTNHCRYSIIRFNAVSEETVIEPLPQFVSEERPAHYSPVTMKVHMETTMRNLALGKGAWDKEKQESTTANYLYIDGLDHQQVLAQRDAQAAASSGA